jgi:hypothetical protein
MVMITKMTTELEVITGSLREGYDYMAKKSFVCSVVICCSVVRAQHINRSVT